VTHFLICCLNGHHSIDILILLREILYLSTKEVCMTDMQFMVVPLEDDDDIQSNTAASRQSDSNEAARQQNNNDSCSRVLPRELRAQFEDMKSIWRKSRRDSSSATPAEKEELKRKERQMAVETALAVDSEISRLQSGIAELEAMLVQQDGPQDENDNDSFYGEEEQLQLPQLLAPPVVVNAAAVVIFPALPPVIAPDYDESSSASEDIDNTVGPDATGSTTTGPPSTS
jgi:hypothetical protein